LHSTSSGYRNPSPACRLPRLYFPTSPTSQAAPFANFASRHHGHCRRPLPQYCFPVPQRSTTPERPPTSSSSLRCPSLPFHNRRWPPPSTLLPWHHQPHRWPPSPTLLPGTPTTGHPHAVAIDCLSILYSPSSAQEVVDEMLQQSMPRSTLHKLW
jgi:hypothetical protein